MAMARHGASVRTVAGLVLALGCGIAGPWASLPASPHSAPAAARAVPTSASASPAATAQVLAPDAYVTRPVASEVGALRTVVDGDFRRLPVLDMNGASTLEVSFDLLSDHQAYLAYRVIHCDCDWQPSDLSELDYAEGFMPVRVVDVRPSFNTFVNYWHYAVSFPNDDVRLLLSGNYAVVFHTEGDPDDVVAVATFAVSEQAAVLEGSVSANTDVDFRAGHQQLSLSLAWSPTRMPYLDAAADVTLVAHQNRQPYTRRVVTTPARLEAQRAWYEHDPRLIFEAGNTWRRFEFVDERYATLGVERVRYHAPYHYVRLLSAQPRVRQPYYYDQDQQGRFLIAARRVDDVDTEADYFWAQFVLDMAPQPEPVYLSGDFTYGLLPPIALMDYDDEVEAYTAQVLLKQGAYNYQFLTLGPDGQPTPGPIEGNRFETQNEYDIWVYYRPPSARYDRLLTTALCSVRP